MIQDEKIKKRKLLSKQLSNYKNRGSTTDQKVFNFSTRTLREVHNDDNNDYNEQNDGESKLQLQISSRSFK